MTPTVSSAPKAAATPSPRRQRTAAIRQAAYDLLEAPVAVDRRAEVPSARRSDGRMILIGALVVTVTAAMGLYLAVYGVYLAFSLLLDAPVWLDMASDLLYGALLLALVLPLMGAIFRMASLMTAARLGVPLALADADTASYEPAVSDVFYPFTSAGAYGRTMLVAGEALLWLVLIFVLPVLLFRVSELPFIYMPSDSTVYVVAVIVRVLACLMVGVGMLLLSGRRAGWGYYLFTCPHMSQRDVARYVRSLLRPFLPVLCLRLRFAGWAALSVVGLGVPFVLHVGPLGLLSAAVYARSLSPDPIPSFIYKGDPS